MCFFVSSLLKAAVTFASRRSADCRLGGWHGCIGILQPSENPFLRPFRRKFTVCLSVYDCSS